MADPTRDAAFDLITAVLERGRTMEAALDALPAGIPGRDRAAAHLLAATVLRRAGSLDALLEPFLNRAPPEPVRNILRLGAAALVFLETPPHAAVGTAVDLAKRRGLAPFPGLVNAVLRKVAATGAAALPQLDSPRLDTPPWLWASWGKSARAIAAAHQSPAPLDISTLPGFVPEGGEALPTGSFRFPAGTGVDAVPGFATGQAWVQDAAAALPARLLAPEAGEAVLDLCAAPGGKTAQLAAMGAVVTAVERDGGRLARLGENLARLKLEATLVPGDATRWRPGRLWSAILLDAPCSATGTIRRHPDIPHLRKPRDIVTLTVLQDNLLDAALALLAPGGRLIYAVCSLQDEEGPERIAAALARHKGLARAPLALPALPEAITPDGALRTTPALWAARGGMDGFYAAKLVKSAAN